MFNLLTKICNIEPVWISDFEFDLTLQETSKFEPFVIEKEEKREIKKSEFFFSFGVFFFFFPRRPRPLFSL